MIVTERFKFLRLPEISLLNALYATQITLRIDILSKLLTIFAVFREEYG